MKEERRRALAELTPKALTLIVQTFVCSQCRRRAAAPAAEPMLMLARSAHSRSTQHIRFSEYPYPIDEALPRRVIHISGPVAYCEHCFTSLDPRQGELFPRRPAPSLPLPFRGERAWEQDGREAPKKPPVCKITLEDF